jgi:hypothetical protein
MARPPDLSDAQLVELYGKVMHELHVREIVRSGNNPIADMAERVVADYYGVGLEPPNRRAYDLVTKEGLKVQVKALRRTQRSRTSLSALRSTDFDLLAVVVFQPDMRLDATILVPVGVVREYMGWSSTWKAHRLSLTRRLLADQRIIRLTAEELVAEQAVRT